MANPDICIIGGGLVGSCLKIALRHTAYSVLQCEANAPFHTTEDTRSIALNQGSIEIFQALGLWEQLETWATPIQHIEITSQGQWGAARLTSPTSAPLGRVIPMHRIMAAMQPLLDPKTTLYETTLTDYDPTTQRITLEQAGQAFSLKPKLIVAADGAHSFLQKQLKLQPEITPFNQQAIVATLTLKRPHRATAYERFTQKGPMALLPLAGQRAGLVYCTSPLDAKTLLSLSNEAFLAHIQKAFGYRAGRFIDVHAQLSFPVEQRFLAQTVYPGLVFVGNAAQTLHPVAGQGLNLGLRDVNVLADTLHQEGLTPAALSHYQQKRQKDRVMISQATQRLVQLFTSQSISLSLLRSAGLSLFGITDCLKPAVMRYASGRTH